VGDYVHESVQVEGKVGHLESDSVAFHVQFAFGAFEDAGPYTTLAAEQLVEQKRQVGWKQLVLDPAWTFWRTYVLQSAIAMGWKD